MIMRKGRCYDIQIAMETSNTSCFSIGIRQLAWFKHTLTNQMHIYTDYKILRDDAEMSLPGNT